MFAKNVLVASGALIAMVAAVPMQHQHHHHQRDYVWVTETAEVVVTVPVTQTVWIEPGESAPTAAADGGHSLYAAPPAGPQAQATYDSAPSHGAPVNSQAFVPPAIPTTSTYVAPAPVPTTTTSVYVAPAAPTTSVYVAPPAPTTSTYVAPAEPTTSSVYVAPAPTTSSVYVAPAAPTTSAWVAPSSAAETTTSAAAASPSSGSSSGGSSGGLTYGPAAAGTTYSGDFTNYTPGMGSCGIENTDSDDIVAVSHIIMNSYPNANPNANPVCNKKIKITGLDGNTYTVTATDTCPVCAESALDMPLPLFNKVTNNGDGRVHNMKWEWA